MTTSSIAGKLMTADLLTQDVTESKIAQKERMS